MRISGSRRLNAARADVFAAIHDPAALLQMVPGCEAIEQVSPTEFRGRLRLRLPAIVGTYETTVRLVESTAPTSTRFEGRVHGALGTIDGSAGFRLRETGEGTTIDYDGSALISGPLAGLGTRFIEGACRSLIEEGLARLDRQLESDEHVPETAARVDGTMTQRREGAR